MICHLLPKFPMQWFIVVGDLNKSSPFPKAFSCIRTRYGVMPLRSANDAAFLTSQKCLDQIEASRVAKDIPLWFSWYIPQRNNQSEGVPSSQRDRTLVLAMLMIPRKRKCGRLKHGKNDSVSKMSLSFSSLNLFFRLGKAYSLRKEPHPYRRPLCLDRMLYFSLNM